MCYRPNFLKHILNYVFDFFIFEAGGSSGILMDLAANDKDVHAHFYNGKVFFFFEKYKFENFIKLL